MRPTFPALLGCCLAALPLHARAQAAGAVQGGDVPLHKGDVVEFDVSGLPRRYEGTAKAICTGTVLRATGYETGTCERAYRFEVPPGEARLVYVFVPAGGGRESRIELPVTRSRKTVTFTAATDGTLRPPAPVTIPAEAAERAARTAATSQCALCVGAGFTLKSYEVTRPAAAIDEGTGIRLKLTTTVPPAAKGR